MGSPWKHGLETRTLRQRLLQKEHQGDVALLWLDSPPVNALDAQLLSELSATLDELAAVESTRVVVLSGRGQCFSAGLDLGFTSTYSEAQRQELIFELNVLLRKLYGFPKPVIAAVNGHAIAGGTVLALACDYRLAIERNCRLGLTEVRVGIPFPVGAKAVVENELSPEVLRRWSLSGERFTAEEALRARVLDELCDPSALADNAMTAAKRYAQIPANAFRQVKAQIRETACQKMDAVIGSKTDPMHARMDLEEARRSASRVLGKKN